MRTSIAFKLGFMSSWTPHEGLGIEVLDHLIVNADAEYYRLKAEGNMEDTKERRVLPFLCIFS